MRAWNYLKSAFIYVIVLSLLLVLLAVILTFQAGGMDVEAAKVYVQALTAIATLALLYYAYFNVESKREEDIARLELAVCPIFVWELEPKNGRALLSCHAMKHPIYDLHASLELGGKRHSFEERHIDVFESNPRSQREYDLTGFITEGLGGKEMRVLSITFSYYSEAGGKYILSFTKEVRKDRKGFLFQHRSFLSAKYPWKEKAIAFSE
jgi:hypothetical protein